MRRTSVLALAMMLAMLMGMPVSQAVPPEAGCPIGPSSPGWPGGDWDLWSNEALASAIAAEGWLDYETGPMRLSPARRTRTATATSAPRSSPVTNGTPTHPTPDWTSSSTGTTAPGPTEEGRRPPIGRGAPLLATGLRACVRNPVAKARLPISDLRLPNPDSVTFRRQWRSTTRATWQVRSN